MANERPEQMSAFSGQMSAIVAALDLDETPVARRCSHDLVAAKDAMLMQ